ncbi:uncharacterized protein LOC143276469 isoform X2 [Babylonia areolata]|uniref:uncharacterized protein LOC143276469 isoform X2 n=1 Tax=Babylonia areolata TaxID=304850 RepID=UPI003FD0DEAC
MAAASDTDSLHDNMTRIRLKMVQRKLANERERLQQPESPSSDDQGGQWKLQQALLRRQQLLDRLKQEQDQRPRSSSPRPRRRSYTPSTLPPPPSRRSLPVDLLRGMSRAYRFNNWYNTDRNVAPQNYVVEHQVAQPQPVVARRPIIELPPIIQIPAAPPPPQVSTVQPAPTVIQQLPAVTYTALPSVPTTTTTNNNKGAPFNKADAPHGDAADDAVPVAWQRHVENANRTGAISTGEDDTCSGSSPYRPSHRLLPLPHRSPHAGTAASGTSKSRTYTSVRQQSHRG